VEARDASQGRAAGRGCAHRIPGVLLALLLFGTPLRAQEVDGFVELTGSRSSQETQITGDAARDVDSSGFFQRYSANARWLLYPNFSFSIGALYERDDSLDDSSSASLDVTRETLRPYISFRLGTEMFSADAGFYRLQDRVDAGAVATRVTRDTINATLNWRPAGLPWWTLYLVRNDLYDRGRRTLDTKDAIAELSMRWQAIEQLHVQYRGSIQTSDNDIEDVEFRLFSQTGRLTYGDAFWERRVLVSAEYNVNYQKRKILSTGVDGGEALVPVFPAAGLSVNDDFPADVILAPNPALTDGNRTTSAGINLGLPPPGGDDTLRNIGLDLTVPSNVDTLRVWVDQTLPVEVSSSFVWQVYSSADNEQWVLEGTASATFTPLDTRFDLLFDDVEARYLKVVTAPLDLGDPSADQFPFIFVTELEAFDRVASDDLPDEPGLKTHRFSGNARVKLLARESFYYDFSYFGIWPDGQPSATSVSNALSFSKQLNRILSVSARAAREDGMDPSLGDFVSYPYTASLRAGWFPTLRQTLVFSGVRTTYSDPGGFDTRFNSLYLQTSADLYEGISMELGLGTNRRNTEGEQTDSDQVNATFLFLPHPTFTATVLYQLRRTDRPGGATNPAIQNNLEAEEVSLSYRPFQALYLYGSYRWEQQELVEDRTLGNYSISWSPFPSGSLQITLRYDEQFRSQFDENSTITSATIRWNLPKGRWVEGGVLRQERTTAQERRQFDTIQANLRWTF
jgi:hypothetical protein